MARLLGFGFLIPIGFLVPLNVNQASWRAYSQKLRSGAGEFAIAYNCSGQSSREWRSLAQIEYSDLNHIEYKGYEISKLTKAVKMRDGSWQGISNVEYVIIKRQGRVIAKFDQLRHPLGAFSRFGLFPFLGGERKQLIVEQTLPRAWQYWIIDLTPKFRVIFDSSKYNLGDELSPEDLDGDGAYEFWQSLFTFWFFDHLCGACSPRIGISFKYDSNTKQYVPANHRFLSKSLEGIDGLISKVREANRRTDVTRANGEDDYLARMMMVIIPLVYAGKEGQAWSFFGREYKRADNTEIKRKILRVLRRDTVYRYVYGR